MTVQDLLNSHSPAVMAVMVTAVTLVVLFVYALANEVEEKRKLYIIVLTVLLCFVTNTVYAALGRVPVPNGAPLPEIFRMIRSMKMTQVWALLSILAFASIIKIVSAINFRSRKISAMSFKEGFDALPEGICAYYENGLCMLVNPLMNRLSHKLFGLPLSDGNRFYDLVRKGVTAEKARCIENGDLPIYETGEGTVYAFKRFIHDTPEGKVYEIIATDITNEYGLNRELHEEIRKQQDLNRRLKEFGSMVEEMTVEKEVLEAKTHAHDVMGRLIYSTRRALREGSAEEKKDELLEGWKTILPLLENKKSASDSDTLNDLYEAADTVGMKVTVDGMPDSSREHQRIFLAAAMECLLNAFRHGNSRTMFVTIRKEGQFTEYQFKNDGDKPKGKIQEGGGLTYLRRQVEQSGGDMTVEYEPEFAVKIRLHNQQEDKHEKSDTDTAEV